MLITRKIALWGHLSKQLPVILETPLGGDHLEITAISGVFCRWIADSLVLIAGWHELSTSLSLFLLDSFVIIYLTSTATDIVAVFWSWLHIFLFDWIFDYSNIALLRCQVSSNSSDVVESALILPCTAVELRLRININYRLIRSVTDVGAWTACYSIFSLSTLHASERWLLVMFNSYIYVLLLRERLHIFTASYVRMSQWNVSSLGRIKIFLEIAAGEFSSYLCVRSHALRWLWRIDTRQRDLLFTHVRVQVFLYLVNIFTWSNWIGSILLVVKTRSLLTIVVSI